MKNKRLTIGYITPRIYLGIQYSYFKGIVEGISEYNINFLCFSGATHGFFLEDDRQANVIFNLVTSDIIDGMICWTTGLFYKNEYIFDIENLLKLNRSIPIVCIGKPLRDFPTITSDNYQGISQLIEHLAEVHKYKKIAFIRGPEYHLYAEERYQGFLKSMRKYNLSTDVKLISKPGEFSNETGINAVKYFFDDMKLNPKKDIDAIVTASDLISVGVVSELKKRGINIPKDISVVGYNNREECIEMTPQLTSVDLQFVETGKIAVKTIMQMTEKKNIPEFVYIPTKLVIRESCGCLNPALIINDKLPLPEFKSKSDKNDFDLSIENKNKIIKELNSNLLKYSDNIHFEKKWTTKLVNSLINEIYSGSKNEFMETLMNIVDEFLKIYDNFFIWQYMISKLYLLILPFLNDKILFLKAENIFHNSRIRLFQKLDQLVIINRLYASSQQNIFPRISSSIVTTFEVSKLLSQVSKEFPKVGIEECYIAVYMDKLHPEYKAQLIMGYNKKGAIDLEKYDTIYNTYNILPKGLFPFNKKNQIIIIPMFFQNNQLGYLLFKISNIDVNLYYTLASYISSALQGSILVKDLENRALELKKTFDDLKDNQERLLAAEKMASLGRMTAGIAHEMNTPLAAARNAINELGILINEYSLSVNNPDVLPEDHEEISKEMKKNFQIALKSIEKGVGFIKGIKSQTTNIFNKKIVLFNADKVISDNLIFLDYMFKKNHCFLIKELEENILLSGDPQSLIQILSNIVINALDACRLSSNPCIRIYLKRMNADTVHLIIKDNGSGIDKENLSKIFDPFFTTKPFGESTGLGLSIVRELVEEFNGSIEVKSKHGDTVFTIIFPLKNKKE